MAKYLVGFRFTSGQTKIEKRFWSKCLCWCQMSDSQISIIFSSCLMKNAMFFVQCANRTQTSTHIREKRFCNQIKLNLKLNMRIIILFAFNYGLWNLIKFALYCAHVREREHWLIFEYFALVDILCNCFWQCEFVFWGDIRYMHGIDIGICRYVYRYETGNYR